MADIYFLNVPTKTYMAINRRNLLSCFSLVKQGRDVDALRCANRAVNAFNKAMRKSAEPGHSFLFKPSAKQFNGRSKNVS